jgi:hypothetical protein
MEGKYLRRDRNLLETHFIYEGAAAVIMLSNLNINNLNYFHKLKYNYSSFPVQASGIPVIPKTILSYNCFFS